jgi:type IV pilus assembly protein PilA
MKIALINENSQAAKNGIIEAALKKVVEPMGHEVVNYGMYAADDAAQLTYVQCGILAAISVPIYLNQRKSAWNSQTESDVKNASLVMETIMTNNNGKVPTLKASSCTGSSTNSKCDIYDGNEVTVSDGVTIVITATAGAGTYTVEGTNSNNTGCKNYVYNSANGSVSSTDHKDLVAKQD